MILLFCYNLDTSVYMLRLKSKKSKFLMVIVAVIVSVVVVFFGYPIIYTPDVMCQAYLKDYPLSTWKTYTDKTNTIQLNYPPDWNSTETEKGASFSNEGSPVDYQKIKAFLSVSVPYDPKYLEPGSKKVKVNGKVAVLEPDYIPIPGDGPWLKEIHFDNQPVHFTLQTEDKRAMESYYCVFDEIVLSMKLLK